MGLLIKNGEIVTAADRFVADLYCDGGTIAALGKSLEKRAANDQVIDASGAYVFPGFIDPHVHMELPFMGQVSADDFESGGASGIAGGTTTFIDFCIPNRGQSLLEGLKIWKEKSAKATSDYTYHMAITGWTDRTADERSAAFIDGWAIRIRSSDPVVAGRPLAACTRRSAAATALCRAGSMNDARSAGPRDTASTTAVRTAGRAMDRAI